MNKTIRKDNEFQVNNLIFTIFHGAYKGKKGPYVHITKYNGKGIHVKIPQSVSYDNITYPVVAIGHRAFLKCKYLRSVHIPVSVDIVEIGAFALCERLHKVRCDNVNTIFKNKAFSVCPKMYDSSGFLIINNVLLDIKIRDPHVVIPNGVEKLMEFTFFCNEILTVTIPHTVVEMGDRCFISCEKLNEVKFLSEDTAHSRGAEKLCIKFQKRKSMQSGLKILPRHCFDKCVSLKKITLPPTVTTIETDAFLGCTQLEEVSLGHNVKTIQKTAFKDCESLKHLSLSEGLEKICENVFENCSSLIEIHIPDSVQHLGKNTFLNCSSLQTLTFGHNEKLPKPLNFSQNFIPYTEYIQAPHPFVLKNWTQREVTRYFQSKLFAISQESAVSKDFIRTSLDKEEFPNLARDILFTQGTVADFDVFIQDGLRLSLDELDFYVSSSIQEEKTAVTAYLLEYKQKNYTKEEIEAHNERSFQVEIGLESPSPFVFSKNWVFEQIEGGIALLEYIGTETQVILPKELSDGTAIRMLKKVPLTKERSVKNNFEPLESLSIYADLLEIEQSVFQDNTTLEEIIFHGEVGKMGDSLFYQCTALRNVVLPEYLPNISDSFCYNCSNLETVTMPKSGLTAIGNHSFYSCSCLQELELPPSLESVGQNAFMHCHALPRYSTYVLLDQVFFAYYGQDTRFTVPDNVTTIKSKAFCKCYTIHHVSIPSSVTTIETGAFQKGALFKELHFLGLNKSNVKIAPQACTIPFKKVILPANATYYPNSFHASTEVVGGKMK